MMLVLKNSFVLRTKSARMNEASAWLTLNIYTKYDFSFQCCFKHSSRVGIICMPYSLLLAKKKKRLKRSRCNFMINEQITLPLRMRGGRKNKLTLRWLHSQ